MDLLRTSQLKRSAIFQYYSAQWSKFCFGPIGAFSHKFWEENLSKIAYIGST